MVKSRILIAMILLLLVALLTLLMTRFAPIVLRSALDSTEYSPGYSEDAFDSVRTGMTQVEVVQLLGKPIGTHEGNPGVTRWYGPPGSSVGEDSGLHIPSGSDASKSGIVHFDLSGERASPGGPYSGQTAEEVEAKLGKPIQEKLSRSVVFWRYSWSPPDGNYHRRWIGFDAEGRVVEKKAYYWWD